MKKIIFIAIMFFSQFTKAEMIVRDSLKGKMLLCENLDYEKDISSNPKAFIIKDVFILFYGDEGYNYDYTRTEFITEVSIMGFIPKDFYNDIAFETPIEIYANGSITGLGKSFLTNGYDYSSFSLSSKNYVEDLPRYVTTTDFIYIGMHAHDVYLDNSTKRTNWITNSYGGLVISRQNLEAKLNYSSLRGVGQYWRNEHEIEKLQCNLIGVNLQEDFFKLERRHYNIINNIKNNKIKKELDSTKDNLL